MGVPGRGIPFASCREFPVAPEVIFNKSVHTSLLLALSLAVTLTSASVASGATPAQTLAARRAALEKAASAHGALEARIETLDDRLAQTSGELDALLEQQDVAEKRLSSRASNLYRAGPVGFVSVLMMAESFESFSARWALLTRITAQDAAAVVDLKRARRRAIRKARQLITLQENAAAQMRAAAQAESRARKDLASSQAEFLSYQNRVRGIRAANRKPAATPKLITKRTGSGAWKSAVASHYGRNFTGRGASGERIGPNSMIVAHKTLPFGTLVEFKYNGKTAVARVADRGPYTSGRTWDLGPGVIRILGFNGVHKVKYRIIGR